VVGLGDDLCEPLCSLFQAVAHLPPIVSWLLLQALLTENSCRELPLPPSLVERLASWLRLQPLSTESLHGEQLLAPPLFSSALRARHLLCCHPFPFLVYYSVFWGFFLQGGSWSVQGSMLVYPRGGCGNTAWCLFAHLLVCMSQAGIWWCSSPPVFSA
jgi:hypothetical protein